MKKGTPSLEKEDRFKKAYKLIWKKATEPFSKMPEAKKTHFHWKNSSVSKKFINSYEKKATEPSSKMPEATKNKHPLKKLVKN